MSSASFLELATEDGCRDICEERFSEGQTMGNQSMVVILNLLLSIFDLEFKRGTTIGDSASRNTENASCFSFVVFPKSIAHIIKFIIIHNTPGTSCRIASSQKF